MTMTSGDLLSPAGDELEAKMANLKKRIAGRLQQGFYSKFSGYGLRRDLFQPIERPQAKIPLSIRPFAEEDLDIILPSGGSDSPEENQEITWRRHFYRKAPKGCAYVAVDMRTGAPCYIQWLIDPSHNPALARFKCFPRLEPDEALLEQAYTIPTHRGLGIMSAAMSMIAEQASNMGARYVLTFVSADGIASLKACHRAGFYPHLMHTRIQIGYGTMIFNNFRKLAEDDPRRTVPFWQPSGQPS
jgi:GNAT superfamily N-acetyltransferase